MLVFEDLHWADDGLLDFVDHLADWATTVPLLIVGDGAARAARPAARLGRRQAQRLHALDRRAHRRRDGPSFSQRSSTAPCSTPTRSRRCCSAPRATRSTPRSTRGCSPSTSGGDLALPETVQGLIAARIDGLAPEEKALLQDASVIGKVFWPGALPRRRRARPARARTEGVRPPRPPLVDRRRDAVRVPARARPRRRLRPDPARGAGGEAPARRGVDRVPRRRPHRGPRRDARPPLPRGALALRGGRARHDCAPRARAAGVRRRRPARVLAERGPDGARLRPGGSRADRPGFAERPALELLCAYAVSAGGKRGRSRADRVGDRGVPRPGRLRARGRSELGTRKRRVLPRRSRRRHAPRALARSSLRAACLPPRLPAVRSLRRHEVQRSSTATSTRALELAREALTIADEAGDDALAATCLNTIGLARVHAGDAGGIDDLERSIERAEAGGSAFDAATRAEQPRQLPLAGRAPGGGFGRIHEARALCERYGFVGGLEWNDAELVYDSNFRGDLERDRRRGLPLPRARVGPRYQTPPVLATRARALLARGQVDAALADAERALTGIPRARAGRTDRRIRPHRRFPLPPRRGTRSRGGLRAHGRDRRAGRADVRPPPPPRRARARRRVSRDDRRRPGPSLASGRARRSLRRPPRRCGDLRPHRRPLSSGLGGAARG